MRARFGRHLPTASVGIGAEGDPLQAYTHCRADRSAAGGRRMTVRAIVAGLLAVAFSAGGDGGRRSPKLSAQSASGTLESGNCTLSCDLGRWGFLRVLATAWLRLSPSELNFGRVAFVRRASPSSRNCRQF